MTFATAQIEALSSRADHVLEDNHARLFALGLAATFHQARLRIKYWLPLTGFDDSTASDQQMLLEELSKGFECLQPFDSLDVQTDLQSPARESQQAMPVLDSDR